MSQPTVSPAEVSQRMVAGEAVVLIDVRSPGEFDRVHAKGARSVPLDELNPSMIAAEPGMAAGDLGKWVCVICQSGTRAAIAARRLSDAGILHVRRVEGGTAAWEKAGLPVERGINGTISLERQVRIAAGTLVLVGLVLARWVHPGWMGLSAFVGAGLIFAGVTDFCGMGILLAKMPWNQSMADK